MNTHLLYHQERRKGRGILRKKQTTDRAAKVKRLSSKDSLVTLGRAVSLGTLKVTVKTVK